MGINTKHHIQSLLITNQLNDALDLCRKYCNENPDDAEVWFLHGTICGQTGEMDEAVKCLQRSIELQGDMPITHYNLGLAYMQQNIPATARDCFEKALSLDPSSVAIRIELANAMQSDGSAEESIPLYLSALAEAPESIPVLSNLSNAYTTCGQLENAIQTYQQLMSVQTDNPDTHYALGNLLLGTGQHEDAIRHYRDCIRLRPDFVEALSNMGKTMLISNSAADAVDAFKKAHDIRRDSAEILFNLGNAYRKNNQNEKAEASYRQSLKIDPANNDALNNLGILLTDNGNMAEAEENYLEAIKIDSSDVSSYINLSTFYRIQRKTEKAIKVLSNAIAGSPDSSELHWEHSLLLLSNGEFKKGWNEYEWRYQEESLHLREFPYRKWQGENLINKTILVTAEQGIGDEIMFASCFADLINVSGYVIIECDPRLVPLFKRSFPKAGIQSAKQSDTLEWTRDIQTPDFHVSAGSLPHYFRNNQKDFPEHKGYLITDSETVDMWHERYEALGEGLIVGISWKGGHISQAKRRSSSLMDWKPLFECSGVHFVNLQYGNNEEELRQIQEQLGVTIHHWVDSNPLKNMDSFAAQISALDLMISVDNSTVHLAGAVDKTAWVLQSYVADWRWMTPSKTSVWYPQITQIYQQNPGTWNEVFDKATKQLLARL